MDQQAILLQQVQLASHGGQPRDQSGTPNETDPSEAT